MKCNVGGMDKAARLVIGAVFFMLAFTLPVGDTWRVIFIVLGAIGLLTGLLRYCPVNALLGLNSCQQKKESHEPGS